MKSSTALEEIVEAKWNALLEKQQVIVLGLGTHQGKNTINKLNSLNGCTIIALLIAMMHLRSTQAISKKNARLAIDQDALPLLDNLRKKYGLPSGAFIDLDDARDFLVECGKIPLDMMKESFGGSMLNDKNLERLVDALECNDRQKSAAALFFHEHVLSIAKYFIHGEVWFDFIDTLPVAGVEGVRVRCKGRDALMACLRKHMWSKMGQEGHAYINSSVRSDEDMTSKHTLFHVSIFSEKIGGQSCGSTLVETSEPLKVVSLATAKEDSAKLQANPAASAAAEKAAMEAADRAAAEKAARETADRATSLVDDPAAFGLSLPSCPPPIPSYKFRTKKPPRRISKRRVAAAAKKERMRVAAKKEWMRVLLGGSPERFGAATKKERMRAVETEKERMRAVADDKKELTRQATLTNRCLRARGRKDRMRVAMGGKGSVRRPRMKWNKRDMKWIEREWNRTMQRNRLAQNKSANYFSGPYSLLRRPQVSTAARLRAIILLRKARDEVLADVDERHDAAVVVDARVPDVVRSFHDVETLLLKQPSSKRLVRVAGDGNCFFSGASHQLYGTENQHREVRLKVCAHLRTHWTGLKNLLSDDDDVSQGQYVQRMTFDKEWGGHIEIAALSAIFGRDVVVYTSSTLASTLADESKSDSRSPTLCKWSHKSTSAGADLIPPIVLAFDGTHYDSVV